MSEYQYVAFQAVDGPLNEEQLAFAQEQSTRAEVSRWSLSVDYSYSSFRGDVDGLLRNGYDVYLQYANYGIREIKLRLPYGMPGDECLWTQYLIEHGLHWDPDDSGPAGILTLCPELEPGQFADDIDETQIFLDAAISIRDRLIKGDLRSLYLLWSCAVHDTYEDPAEVMEPPVPHGVAEAEAFGGDLLLFYELDPMLLVAAGSDVPPAPDPESAHQPIDRWLDSLKPQQAKDILRELLAGDTAGEKARLLAMIRGSQVAESWPTTDMQRTLQDVLEKAAALRAEEDARQAREAQRKAEEEEAAAQRRRAERMAQMALNPERWLELSEQYASCRTTANYKLAAEILSDLREAVGGEEGRRLACGQAEKLANTNPTLTRLKGSLRKRGLIP